MPSTYDIISGLTSSINENVFDTSILINQFSEELGWVPSYDLSPGDERSYVSTHLVVEHGLKNSAIISFLTKSYFDLSFEERKKLLNISYNNLVDWHIHVEKNQITYVNNRVDSDRRLIKKEEFYKGYYDSLRSEAFEKVIGERVSTNIPTLDTVLIETVRYWKVNLSAEYQNQLSNSQISTLFNGIFFIRALEDNNRRYNKNVFQGRVLLSSLDALKNHKNLVSIKDVFRDCLEKLNYNDVPDYLIDEANLSIFDNTDWSVWRFLFNDFYDNKRTSSYTYDFSIMSHHSLSRIYERYISILGVEDENQLTFFTPLATEYHSAETGAVYTPQYIAKFFSRFLKLNVSPFDFQRTKVFEPAVGSGMFLRSFLETKCDLRDQFINEQVVKSAFENVTGVDIDINAVKASQLSLALLHLVLTDSFPESLDIIHADTVDYYLDNVEKRGTYNAVISNPPFISIEKQSEENRKKFKQILGDLAGGRVDSYLAFLKLGLDMIANGGYGLFVIPHSFLISKNAKKLRKYISDNFVINYLIDLSAIQVFGNTGIYVVLLIVQKRVPTLGDTSVLVKCENKEGYALQAALKWDFTETSSYSVYKTQNSIFCAEEWYVLPKREVELKTKLEVFPKITEFVEVRQGFVSGNDKVFIVEKVIANQLGIKLFRPYLSDKEMEKFDLPDIGELDKYLFWPFDENGNKISIESLEESYPKLFQYFLKYKEILLKPKTKNEHNWIYPHRPRQETLLQPKVICPHLMFTPKFALDSNGAVVVSRTPFIYLKSKFDETQGIDILKYLTAVLNSSACFWYISTHSHKYGGGYSMIEVKTLKTTPIPDPSRVSSGDLNKLVSLVDDRLESKGYDAVQIDRQIDKIVSKLYNLTEKDMSTLGIL